ncbi:MAG: DUF1566 domain-containing protein, partial [Gammaproteobacteria bacterium]
AIGTWETTLLARNLDGNPSTIEAWYDTTLDITWLANANLAASNSFGLSYSTDLGTYPGDSSGYHGFVNSDGTMNWPGAMFWLDAMNASNSGAGYLGYNDWRLPTMMDTGMSGCDNPNSNSGTDCGYNVQTTSGSPPYPAATVYSEIASMYYDTLGNLAFANPSFSNPGPFDNIQSVKDDYYWTGLEYAPNTDNAWLFTFNSGKQTYYNKNGDPYPIYAWAVHPGDIGTAVPLPAAVWLFGGGLLGLIGVGRRRH